MPPLNAINLYKGQSAVLLFNVVAPDWLPLDQAKEQAMDRVQNWRNNAMRTPRALETSLGWPVEYTQEAMTLAMGVAVLMNEGLSGSTSWTDANNVRHDNIGKEEFKAIAGALGAHVRSIQDRADELRARIQTATAETLGAVMLSIDEEPEP